MLLTYIITIRPIIFNRNFYWKIPAFCHVDDRHRRNGIAHFNVLRCHRTIKKQRVKECARNENTER